MLSVYSTYPYRFFYFYLIFHLYYRSHYQNKNQKNSTVHYQVGENIKHPTFGDGTIEQIQQDNRSVKLHIRFKNETKIIDQSWLLKTKGLLVRYANATAATHAMALLTAADKPIMLYTGRYTT